MDRRWHRRGGPNFETGLWRDALRVPEVLRNGAWNRRRSLWLDQCVSSPLQDQIREGDSVIGEGKGRHHWIPVPSRHPRSFVRRSCPRKPRSSRSLPRRPATPRSSPAGTASRVPSPTTGILLAEPDIEMVTIAAPNHLHREMTIAAARAGKHVVCREAACMTLEEADNMIEVCRAAGCASDVRRGALLHPEIRQGQGDGRPGRVRRCLSREAERDAFRAARRLVLGRRALRRRRVHGHGMSRPCLLLLVPWTSAADEHSGPHGHLRPSRQDAGRGPLLRDPRVRERRHGTRRGQLGAARRHGRSNRGLRVGRSDLR